MTSTVENETIELTLEEFRKLPEYSTTLPTGPKPGFRWRRNVQVFDPVAQAEEKIAGVMPDWVMAETYELDPPDPGQVGIRWKNIKIKE